MKRFDYLPMTTTYAKYTVDRIRKTQIDQSIYDSVDKNQIHRKVDSQDLSKARKKIEVNGDGIGY